MKIEVTIPANKVQLSDTPNYLGLVDRHEVTSLEFTLDIRLHYSSNYLNIEFVLCKYKIEYDLFATWALEDAQTLIANGFELDESGDYKKSFTKGFVGEGTFKIEDKEIDLANIFFHEQFYTVDIDKDLIEVS